MQRILVYLNQADRERSSTLIVDPAVTFAEKNEKAISMQSAYRAFYNRRNQKMTIRVKKNMKQTMQVNWDRGLEFSTAINGHTVSIDAPEEVGGRGSAPNPKSLMVMALAGCTGIDVVSILKKMKIEVEHFSIEVESTLTEEHPKVYTAMHIIYTFQGKDLKVKKIKKAIELSQDKYCGVSAMYRKAMDITYEINITGNYS